MNKKKRFELPRGEFYLMMTLIFFTFFMAGGLMNGVAVLKNDCRMPVKWEYKMDTDRHFNYLYDTEINYAYLTDRYHISRIAFSVGDVIIIVSALLTITFCMMWSINVRRRKKEWKKEHYQK